MFNFFKAAKGEKETTIKVTQSSKEDFDVYFLNNYQRYARFKHACIGDSTWGNAKPTLTSCTCGDFKKTGLPCFHMYTIAISDGVYDNIFGGHDDLVSQMESLSPSAFAKFGEMLYAGYYEGPHRLSDLGRYKGPIIDSGLISVESDEFFYSEDVKANLYFVIHYIMSDERFRKTRFTAQAWAEMHQEKNTETAKKR